MFVYRSRFLLRGEVWFDNEPDDSPVDWILYRQRSKPVPKSRWKFFYTRLIDLRKSLAELLAEMEPVTVSKIRMAEEKDGISVACCDLKNSKVLGEFEEMWNQFARAKNSAPLDHQWLQQMILADTLNISAAKDGDGGLLVYHTNYYDENRVQQLMAVSPYRSSPDIATRRKINRANCLLHWSNMLRAKEQGVRYFDFGGWYTGSTDIELLGMNAFKKGFGGEVVREYQCQQIMTFKAWLLLMLARFVKSSGKKSPNNGKYKVSPAL